MGSYSGHMSDLAGRDSVLISAAGPVRVSTEVAEAQQQWLRDGTVPASYVAHLIGAETVLVIGASSPDQKRPSERT